MTVTELPENVPLGPVKGRKNAKSCEPEGSQDLTK
jgi:hypothetical protein